MIMFYLEPCGSLAFTNSSFIAVEIMFSMASYFFEVITGCVVVYVKVNTPVVVCMHISDCIDVKKIVHGIQKNNYIQNKNDALILPFIIEEVG